MEWILIVSLVLIKPVTDGAPQDVGDVLHSRLIGSTMTLAQCVDTGEKLAEVYERQSGGSLMVFHACREVSAEVLRDIVRDQGWVPLKKGEPL